MHISPIHHCTFSIKFLVRPFPIMASFLFGMSGSRASLFDGNDSTHRRSDLQSTIVANSRIVCTSAGVEVDEDYALALKKKVRRQARLESMTNPSSSSDKRVTMTQRLRAPMKLRGSVAKQSRKVRSITAIQVSRPMASKRKASITLSTGDEVTSDYALALRKKGCRQASLAPRGAFKSTEGIMRPPGMPPMMSPSGASGDFPPIGVEEVKVQSRKKKRRYQPPSRNPGSSSDHHVSMSQQVRAPKKPRGSV